MPILTRAIDKILFAINISFTNLRLVLRGTPKGGPIEFFLDVVGSSLLNWYRGVLFAGFDTLKVL